MRKRNTAALLFVILLTAAVCLAGCGREQPAEQPADQPAEQGNNEKASSSAHEAYGVSYVVPDTDWDYMFNADQLGSGEEWADLEISGKSAEEGLKEYWEKACKMDDPDDEDSVLKDSGSKEVDGRECYWYDRYSDDSEGMSYWIKVILIPQSDDNRFIEIRSDFIESEDKEKADSFFDELLNHVEFTDDESFMISDEYIAAGGVKLSAKGLKPGQLFYGLTNEEDTDGLVSMHVDFDEDGYAEGPEQAFVDMDWEENSMLKGDGKIEIDGVQCKWYAYVDSMPDSMTYMSYVVMIPHDDLKTIMSIAYDFDADKKGADDLEEHINKIKEQIHITG